MVGHANLSLERKRSIRCLLKKETNMSTGRLNFFSLVTRIGPSKSFFLKKNIKLIYL
jgi:hypothetical protein